MRNRRIALAVAALALVAISARHPATARLEFQTHEATDPSPHRFQAGLDLGVAAVSVLVTWTGRQLRNN